ncbi:hypothetical protein ACF1GS_29560 [Streptomyces eurythermus]|uniref:hypothetical protein n=1 Tax=Streptomyces eurythermus TaxID=42237 RepID=UPI0036F5F643
MTSVRPASSPAARRGRAVAVTAGTALGLGALVAAPSAAAGTGGTDLTGRVALTAVNTAAPAVTLDTTSVRAGGEVRFTATGFPAGGRLSVKLDDATLLAQFTVGDGGSVSGRVTIPAATSTGDGHWLRFLATGTSPKSESLTVTAAPPASPTPTPAPTPSRTTAPATDPKVRLTGGNKVTAGGRVSFALSGFAKGQNITVKLDDGAVLGRWNGAVKADGTFTGTVTVPAPTAAGAHWLRVLAPDPATSLRADLTVTSSSPSPGGGSGGSGGSGTAGGSGGASGPGGVGGATDTNASGRGSASSGTSTGASPAASATVTGGSRVAAGGKVSFRVTGFPAGRQLTVKLDDSKILGRWTVGSDGSHAGIVTVPPDATKGAHWLRFLAPDPPTSLRADFTVTSEAAASSGSPGGSPSGAAGGVAVPVPAASGAPAAATDDAGAKAEITAGEVQPGGTLHFKVTAFPAGKQVTVKLDDEAILGQWKTDGDGSYEGDVTVPDATSAGAHWLRFLAPDPPTSLKVEFTVNAAAAAGPGTKGSAMTAPGTATQSLVAASHSTVSYATVAWSAAAAAAGGAAGAAATTLMVVRRRTARPAHGA